MSAAESETGPGRDADRDMQMMTAGAVAGFGFALLLVTFFDPAGGTLATLVAATVSAFVILVGFILFAGTRSIPPGTEEGDSR